MKAIQSLTRDRFTCRLAASKISDKSEERQEARKPRERG